MNESTASEPAPDYDLTCWYLNKRRIIELVGGEAVSSRLEGTSRFAGNPMFQEFAAEAAMKDSITAYLTAAKPPTLGELVIRGEVSPGRIFTHYTNWFFKGLSQADKAMRKGANVVPPALACAKLDAFRPNARVECPFHAEHLTANSAWSELTGQKTKFVLGLITGVEGDLIQAVPYVIANLAPGWDRPASLIGRHWLNRLEVFPSEIDAFEGMQAVEPPRRKTDLNVLRDIPEDAVKHAFAEILGEPTVPKDWGGERSDLFSTRVAIDGRQISAAFAFKGPAKFAPMTLATLGKNGDQIDRLYTEPAELLVLQHCHEITGPVRGAMRAYAQRMGDLRLFCLIDGYATLQILNAYSKCGLGLKKHAAERER